MKKTMKVTLKINEYKEYQNMLLERGYKMIASHKSESTFESENLYVRLFVEK